jgi:O-antigen/teichoic acid export membrane protein
MIIKVIGMAAGLGVSVFLGRTIGAEGLGVINLANRIVGLLLVLAMFGFDNVLIKHIAIAYEYKNWQKVANSLHTSIRFNGLLALGISTLSILSTPFLINHVFNDPQLHIPLIIALVVILPQTLSRIYAAGLIGFRKIWQSNLVNETLSIWIVGIGLLLFRILGKEINIVNASTMYGIGRLIVTLSMAIYWKHIFHFSGEKRSDFHVMIKTALPLLLVSTSLVILSSIDTLMVGIFFDSKSVGLYSVALRLALLVSFVIQISNATVMPKCATLYNNGKLAELKVMVQRTTFGLTIIGLLTVIFFVIAGKWLLALWGEEFIAGYPLLVIIAIGQFVNMASGPVGSLLSMSGHEKILRNITIFSVLLNIGLNILLINLFGLIGVAMATAISTITVMCISTYQVNNKIGFLPFKTNFTPISIF